MRQGFALSFLLIAVEYGIKQNKKSVLFFCCISEFNTYFLVNVFIFLSNMQYAYKIFKEKIGFYFFLFCFN